MRRCGCLLAVVMLAGASLSEGQKAPRQPTPAIVRPLATSIHSFAVSPGTVSFAASDPDLGTFAGSPATSVTWNLTGGNASTTWTLRVASSGSWFGGGSAGCGTVPAGAVTVTCASATTSGGVSSTASCSAAGGLSTTYRTIASGQEGSGKPSFTVTLSFTLLDSWSYVANVSPPCTLNVSYSLNAP